MTPREEIDLLRREVADLRARIAMLEAQRYQIPAPTIPSPPTWPYPQYPVPWYPTWVITSSGGTVSHYQ